MGRWVQVHSMMCGCELSMTVGLWGSETGTFTLIEGSVGCGLWCISYESLDSLSRQSLSNTPKQTKYA